MIKTLSPLLLLAQATARGMKRRVRHANSQVHNFLSYLQMLAHQHVFEILSKGEYQKRDYRKITVAFRIFF